MYPFVFVAVLMAALFAVTALKRRHAAGFLAAGLWALYAVYEYYVASGVLCDANCNIRVDLLLFLPILIWASVLGLRQHASNRSVAVFGAVCLLLVSLLAPAFGYRILAVAAGAGALALVVYAFRAKSAA